MRRDRSQSDTGTEKLAHDQRCDGCAGELGNPVRDYVGGLNFTSDQNTECHRGIIMSARDVAPGIYHHHERRAYGQRGDHPSAGADYSAANRQDKKECSDEFGDVFVHNLPSTGHSLRKARHINNGTFVLSPATTRTRKTSSVQSEIERLCLSCTRNAVRKIRMPSSGHEFYPNK